MATKNDPVIADSSGLISLLHQGDSNHQAALESVSRIPVGTQLLILSDVFSETMNASGLKINRDFAILAGSMLNNSKDYTLIEADQELRSHALQKWKTTKARESFIDCLVMALADRYQTTKIFGFDGAFKENGYSLP
jgi:predicted nucleic acid-binding protein